MLLVVSILLAVYVVPAPWGIVLVACVAVFEVVETIFFIRLSRRRRIRAGAETLIGARGEVVRACRPDGFVRVQGELWQATCPAGADPGDEVRVVARDGLVLAVEPEAPEGRK